MNVILETHIGMFSMDPEDLPGAPDNATIYEQNPDLKKFGHILTDEERKGFLEMWRISAVATSLAMLPDEDLTKARTAAITELNEQTATEKRTLKLRSMRTLFDREVTNRFYTSKK